MAGLARHAYPVDTRALALRFIGRHQEIIEGYQARLREIENPLALDETNWRRCRAEAQQILDRCAETLCHGVIGSNTGPIAAMALDVDCGVHLSHSARAGVILFEISVGVLMEEISEERGCLTLLEPALHTLQSGIGQGLADGVVDYDAMLLAKVRELHTETHRRIARDLHDNVGNGLSLAMRQLELLELADDDGDERGFRITAAKVALVDALDRMRDVITDLRKPVDRRSLETALRAYVGSMAAPGTTVTVQVFGSEEHVPATVLDQVFLTLRECLRNAFTHARASGISVRVEIDSDGLLAEVVDDGIGFDVAGVRAADRANGLSGMTERVAALGGVLVVDSAPGQGTTVSISLPVKGAPDRWEQADG